MRHGDFLYRFGDLQRLLKLFSREQLRWRWRVSRCRLKLRFRWQRRHVELIEFGGRGESPDRDAAGFALRQFVRHFQFAIDQYIQQLILHGQLELVILPDVDRVPRHSDSWILPDSIAALAGELHLCPGHGQVNSIHRHPVPVKAETNGSPHVAACNPQPQLCSKVPWVIDRRNQTVLLCCSRGLDESPIFNRPCSAFDFPLSGIQFREIIA